MRLIDADRLIQGLYVIRDRETGIPRSLANWFLSMVDETPTIQPQGIDKDRLIEFLKRERKDWKVLACEQYEEAGDGGMDAIDSVLDWVNQQPTSDGWIPVSSGKLPTKEDYSEDGFVLVQTGGGIIYKGCYEIESGFWVDETGFKFAYLPIAWQPLPPAYKESE